jgi:hypothetical protein
LNRLWFDFRNLAFEYNLFNYLLSWNNFLWRLWLNFRSWRSTSFFFKNCFLNCFNHFVVTFFCLHKTHTSTLNNFSRFDFSLLRTYFTLFFRNFLHVLVNWLQLGLLFFCTLFFSGWDSISCALFRDSRRFSWFATFFCGCFFLRWNFANRCFMSWNLRLLFYRWNLFFRLSFNESLFNQRFFNGYV